MSFSTQLILVVNCGSSSLKFSVLPLDERAPIVSGTAECLGLPDARIAVKHNGVKRIEDLAGGAHEEAFGAMFRILNSLGFLQRVSAVGHRVVQGGELFQSSTIVTPQVLTELETLTPLAPLHHPANLLGIRICMNKLPHVPQTAVFDTAFHQTLPAAAYTYAAPRSFQRDHGIRRYGFHGASHQYAAGKAVRMLGLDPDNHGLVIAHLDDGASATAVVNGASVDTTMGMTPLEGLVMGARSGDIDFGAVAFMARTMGLGVAEIEDILNRKSGLLGVSELSSDCRELETAASEGHEGAQLALDVFVHRLARHIGALATSMPRLDALVFTGGIGETSAHIRAATVRRLSILGLDIDEEINKETVGHCGRVSAGLHPAVLVVVSDEDSVIAQDAANLARLHETDPFLIHARIAF